MYSKWKQAIFIAPKKKNRGSALARKQTRKRYITCRHSQNVLLHKRMESCIHSMAQLCVIVMPTQQPNSPQKSLPIDTHTHARARSRVGHMYVTFRSSSIFYQFPLSFCDYKDISSTARHSESWPELEQCKSQATADWELLTALARQWIMAFRCVFFFGREWSGYLPIRTTSTKPTRISLRNNAWHWQLICADGKRRV